MADVATVRAICTYRRAIGEKKKVGVGGHLITAFRAFEAINMKEGLTEKRLLEQGQLRGACTRNDTHPNATTRPPCSVTADFLHPGHRRSSNATLSPIESRPGFMVANIAQGCSIKLKRLAPHGGPEKSEREAKGTTRSTKVQMISQWRCSYFI
jgi:hypothetical protein